MNKLWALLLTFITGLVFLIGLIIAKRNKKKEPLRIFANSMALIVMFGLVIFDLIPEVITTFKKTNLISALLVIGCFSVLGFIILKLIDMFIPEHHHQHKNNERNHQEHDFHLVHIGLITAFSIITHNFIEGMALYATTLTSLKAGLIMMLSIALHNIPLGMEIALSIEKKTKSKVNIMLYFILSISALLGASVLLLIGHINEFILGCIMCLTIGMILYIITQELLMEFWTYKKNKEAKIGIAIGLIIVGITLLI